MANNLLSSSMSEGGDKNKLLCEMSIYTGCKTRNDSGTGRFNQRMSRKS